MVAGQLQRERTRLWPWYCENHPLRTCLKRGKGFDRQVLARDKFVKPHEKPCSQTGEDLKRDGKKTICSKQLSKFEKMQIHTGLVDFFLNS